MFWAQFGQLVTAPRPRFDLLVGEDGGGDGALAWAHPLTLLDDLRGGHVGRDVVSEAGLAVRSRL